MNASHHQKQIPLSLIISLLVITLFGILIFGLNPKDFYLSNRVSRLPDSPGIKFGEDGIAYTGSFFEAIQNEVSEPGGFSFEIPLKPNNSIKDGFNFIIVLHNGKDSDQLLMGQWRTHIIFMNGDDYSNKKRMKRISVDTATLPAKGFFITVTTSQSGTKIYADGNLLREKKDLILKIPNEAMKARLIIGNSVYGRNSWEGTIYGLAFYQYALTPQHVFAHYDHWLKKNNFSYATKANPYLLYVFDETDSSRALDHSGRNNHLNIPARMKILKKKFLSLPTNFTALTSVLFQDVILNLLGFIPLGFSLTAAMLRMEGAIGKRSQLMAVVFGFLLSLSIEFVQAWAPTRSSDIHDLIFNTSGTLIGAIIYKPVLYLAGFRE